MKVKVLDVKLKKNVFIFFLCHIAFLRLPKVVMSHSDCEMGLFVSKEEKVTTVKKTHSRHPSQNMAPENAHVYYLEMKNAFPEPFIIIIIFHGDSSPN